MSFLLILSGNKTLTEKVKSGATTLIALLPTVFTLQLIHERTYFSQCGESVFDDYDTEINSSISSLRDWILDL